MYWVSLVVCIVPQCVAASNEARQRSTGWRHGDSCRSSLMHRVRWLVMTVEPLFVHIENSMGWELVALKGLPQSVKVG